MTFEFSLGLDMVGALHKAFPMRAKGGACLLVSIWSASCLQSEFVRACSPLAFVTLGLGKPFDLPVRVSSYPEMPWVEVTVVFSLSCFPVYFWPNKSVPSVHTSLLESWSFLLVSAAGALGSLCASAVF